MPSLSDDGEAHGVGLVLGCEITYDASLYGPLAHTLHRLLTSHPSRAPAKRPFHPFDAKGPRALLLHNPESTPSCRQLPMLLDKLKGEYGMLVTVTEMAELLGDGDGRRWIPEERAPMLLIDVRPGR
jgi:hypothetical protein